jgi:hypothetical protein
VDAPKIQLGAVNALFAGRPRRVRLLAVAFVVGAVLLGSVASVTAGENGNHNDKNAFRVLDHATSFKSVGSGTAAGDELFVGGTVLRFASPHDQIGTFGIHCAATGAGGSEILCDAAYILPDGQITLQVLVPNPPPSTFAVAITGGTGAYRDASGEATVVTLSSGDEDVTFHFNK